MLYGPIGDTVDQKGRLVQGISGSAFAAEMQYLQNNTDKITVHINSMGGSVLEGYSIASSILNSKVPVHTKIDGLAASIAGVIAVCGETCTAKDFATWMGHEAAGGEDERVRNMVTDTLITVLTNRTKKTPEEIKAMLVKETWISNSRHADFTLEQGVSMGIFDSIESTGKKANIRKSESLVNMALIYNSLLTEKPKMEKITNKLGLSNEASEDSIVSKITEKDAEIVALKAEVTAIKNAEATRVANEKTELTNKSTKLVEKLIEEGKLKETEKAETITALVNNFDFTASLLGKLTNVKAAVKVFDFKNTATGEDRSAWSFSDWSKNDPEGLLKLQNEAPEAFKSLIDKLPKQLSNNYTPIAGIN